MSEARVSAESMITFNDPEGAAEWLARAPESEIEKLTLVQG
jgi:hypothetical protein